MSRHITHAMAPGTWWEMATFQSLEELNAHLRGWEARYTQYTQN